MPIRDDDNEEFLEHLEDVLAELTRSHQMTTELRQQALRARVKLSRKLQALERQASVPDRAVESLSNKKRA